MPMDRSNGACNREICIVGADTSNWELEGTAPEGKRGLKNECLKEREGKG